MKLSEIIFHTEGTLSNVLLWLVLITGISQPSQELMQLVLGERNIPDFKGIVLKIDRTG